MIDLRPIDTANEAECAAILVAIAGRLSVLAVQARESADRTLNAKQAALRLGISTSMLYRERHRLPFAKKIGGRVVYSQRGLERWIASQEGRA